MTKKNIEILVKSLQMIANFAERIYHVTFAWEYIQIHHRNLQMLQSLSQERKAVYMQQKITEYPEISEQEIHFYILEKRGERRSNFFDFIVQFISKKKRTLPQIERKIFKIASLNDELVKMVENPYWEELYQKESSL